METRFAQLARSVGLVAPIRQWPVVDASDAIVARVDFASPGARLAVECDGAWHDASAERRAYDRRRDATIVTITGCRVVHLDWHQVVGQPTTTVRMLRTLLRP